MKILIAGATGFIGHALVRRLIEQGNEVTALSRNAPKATSALHIPAIGWGDEGGWRAAVGNSDAVVNLSGESIAAHRWTDDVKKTLESSRIGPTERLVSAHPRVLVQAAAVGYYGDRGEETLDEDAGPGDDFLAHLGLEWEIAARTAEAEHRRVVLMRTGQVLGRGGGMLESFLHPPMLPFSPFKLGLGGPLGKGDNWLPWVHIEDVLGLYILAISDHRATGAINVVSPGIVRGKDFATSLGRAIGKPAAIPIPKFVLKIALGDFADCLVNSQKVVPGNAFRLGYAFRYPRLDLALENLLQ